MALQLDIYNLYYAFEVKEASITVYAHLGTFLSREAFVARASEHYLSETGQESSPHVYFGKRGDEARWRYVCEPSVLGFES